MKNKNRVGKVCLVGLVALIMVMQSNDAFAGDRDRGREKKREVVRVDQRRYSYHDGRFYKPGFLWFEISLSHPPIGAVVTFLPFGYSTVVIGKETYYRHSNVYYKHCSAGYVVVPMPVENYTVVSQNNAIGQKVSINIPNSNGSFTTVILTKQRNGYIGPQGEYYPGNPTLEQLKALYGK